MSAPIFLCKILTLYSESKFDVEKSVLEGVISDILDAYGENLEIEFSDILNDYYICEIVEKALEYCSLNFNFTGVDKKNFCLLKNSLKTCIFSCQNSKDDYFLDYF